MEKLKLEKDNLRKFGIIIGTAFFVLTLFILLKQRNGILATALISALFFIFAFTNPVILKPVYILWMRLAFVLAWVNTRLILFIVFYLVFTPIGLGMKLFGLDLLDRKIEKNNESYWIKKEKKSFNLSDYRRQF